MRKRFRSVLSSQKAQENVPSPSSDPNRFSPSRDFAPARQNSTKTSSIRSGGEPSSSDLHHSSDQAGTESEHYQYLDPIEASPSPSPTSPSPAPPEYPLNVDAVQLDQDDHLRRPPQIPTTSDASSTPPVSFDTRRSGRSHARMISRGAEVDYQSTRALSRFLRSTGPAFDDDDDLESEQSKPSAPLNNESSLNPSVPITSTAMERSASNSTMATLGRYRPPVSSSEYFRAIEAQLDAVSNRDQSMDQSMAHEELGIPFPLPPNPGLARSQTSTPSPVASVIRKSRSIGESLKAVGIGAGSPPSDSPVRGRTRSSSVARPKEFSSSSNLPPTSVPSISSPLNVTLTASLPPTPEVAIARPSSSKRTLTLSMVGTNSSPAPPQETTTTSPSSSGPKGLRGINFSSILGRKKSSAGLLSGESSSPPGDSKSSGKTSRKSKKVGISSPVLSASPVDGSNLSSVPSGLSPLAYVLLNLTFI